MATSGDTVLKTLEPRPRWIDPSPSANTYRQYQHKAQIIYVSKAAIRSISQFPLNGVDTFESLVCPLLLLMR